MRLSTTIHAATLTALIGASACNAVLGIEEAQLRSSAGGSGGGSAGTAGSTTQKVLTNQVEPIETCSEPMGECSSCIQSNCSSTISECLRNRECREALDEYRVCLGAGCRDAGTCMEDLDLTRLEAARCITTNCTAACAESPVISVCELYCSCMQANCSEFLLGECVQTCETQLNVAQVGCRWAHCEFAAIQPVPHCEHAIGEQGFCDGAPPVNDCSYARISGWTRSSNDECCSGVCDAAREICQ